MNAALLTPASEAPAITHDQAVRAAHLRDRFIDTAVMVRSWGPKYRPGWGFERGSGSIRYLGDHATAYVHPSADGLAYIVRVHDSYGEADGGVVAVRRFVSVKGARDAAERLANTSPATRMAGAR